ncbi:MAG TPA: MlaD family protein [Prolixibacteraceae bacterium]|nr:MlaD family protein [Prolixibacteraceae bacterium]
MRISKFVKIGFLMVFSITALVWGLSYLKGHDFFKPVNYYYARYPKIDGLQESSYVTVNGFRVGTVKKIEFAEDKSGDLIVTFMIDNDFRIPANSAAHIVSSDIMGTRAVKLLYSDSPVYFSPGDTIPGEIEGDLKEQVSLQVLPLKKKAEELLSTIDSAITVLTVIFNEDARKNLSESFENINRTINNLENTSKVINELMVEEKSNISKLISNMEGITGNLKNNSERFDNVIRNLSILSDTLASLPFTPVVTDMSKAVNSLQVILSKISSDQSTAGLLFNDDELYYNITGLTANLERLMTDIRSNPKRYLHFSALDMGRNVYVNASPSQKAENLNLTFRVHLVSTTTQIPAEAPVFAGLGKIEEFITNGSFAYFAGNTNDYLDIERTLTRAQRNFPDAYIQPYRDGKEIKLEKALRLLNK